MCSSEPLEYSIQSSTKASVTASRMRRALRPSRFRETGPPSPPDHAVPRRRRTKCNRPSSGARDNVRPAPRVLGRRWVRDRPGSGEQSVEPPRGRLRSTPRGPDPWRAASKSSRSAHRARASEGVPAGRPLRHGAGAVGEFQERRHDMLARTAPIIRARAAHIRDAAVVEPDRDLVGRDVAPLHHCSQFVAALDEVQNGAVPPIIAPTLDDSRLASARMAVLSGGRLGKGDALGRIRS